MKQNRMCEFLASIVVAGVVYSGCLLPTEATAQNTTCSDRPLTDSSNACANTRFVQSSSALVVIPISAYGAKCDDSTDDTIAIQNAWNAAANVGSNVWLGGVGIGICKFSSLTMPTPSTSVAAAGKSALLTGPGASQVVLNSTVTGTTCAINVSATYGINSNLDGAMQGFTLQQRAQAQGGKGFCLNNITALTFRDVGFRYFSVGMQAIDSILLTFDGSRFYRNTQGATGAFSANSNPNGWNFIGGTHFIGQYKNAISLNGAGLLNVDGSEFESNGLDTGADPVTIDLIGQPGTGGPSPTVGANVLNSYFEGNNGVEVRISQNAVANTVGIYNVQNNLFTRTLATQTGGVLITNNGTGASQTTVNVGGNGFFDNLASPSGFAWLVASTPATANYLFNCATSNRADIAAEMPVGCRNATAGTMLASDILGQYIGYTPTPALGTAGSVVGSLSFRNATSGSVTIQPATGALGTQTILTPAASGTLGVAATSPITLSATGTIACPTCATSSGGGAVTGTAPISVSGAGVVSLDDAGVTFAKIQNLNALSIIGRSANSSGVSANISAVAASDSVLRESGSTIGFGTIATGGIANNAVTLAKLATQATNTVLGNATSGTAVPTALAVGSCSTSASALNWTTNTGFGCNTAIAAATVTTNANLTGAVTSVGNATSLGSFSSANLRTALTDETGSGLAVFGTDPTFSAGITVNNNIVTSTINNVQLTSAGSTAILTIGSAKTVVLNNSLTFAGTDGTTLTFPTTNATIARTDAAQTFTGIQTFGTIAPTTINAFTLGGTLSGGGNQINNVIIGTTTPLAGTFTTLTANTSISSPIHTAPGAFTFQSNGSTFAGSISTAQQWLMSATSNTTPTNAILTLSKNTAVLPNVLSGVALQIGGADGTTGPVIGMQAFNNTTAGGQGAIHYYKSRGTAGTPASVQSGDVLGANFAFGYTTSGSTGYLTNAGAGFLMQATEAYTSTAAGSRVDIYATPATTAVLAISASFGSGVMVGTTTDPGAGKISFTNGITANGNAGITTVCTIAVGNVLTFTLGILTAKGGVAGCT